MRTDQADEPGSDARKELPSERESVEEAEPINKATEPRLDTDVGYEEHDFEAGLRQAQRDRSSYIRASFSRGVDPVPAPFTASPEAVIELTTGIVVAYVSSNSVPASELPLLIVRVHRAITERNSRDYICAFLCS